MLEILIPPRGFHSGLILTILVAILYYSIIVSVLYDIASDSWDFVGWFILPLLVFPFLRMGWGLIWTIIWTLFGTVRLRITQSEISRSLELFGLRYRLPLTAPRQDITKIELIRISSKKDYKGDTVAVPPQINIWAGTKKCTLGAGDHLTPPELDWLYQELICWLTLPISRNSEQTRE